MSADRTGCCAGWPKPCSYHEGYQDALGEMESTRRPDRILWNTGRKEVDEIVVYDVMLHLEQMTDHGWWMGIYRGDYQLMVNLCTVSQRSRMTVTCDDDGTEPWPWAKDEEHAMRDEAPLPAPTVPVDDAKASASNIEPPCALFHDWALSQELIPTCKRCGKECRAFALIQARQCCDNCGQHLGYHDGDGGPFGIASMLRPWPKDSMWYGWREAQLAARKGAP